MFRDVPKTVTLKEIAKLFPDAVSFALYDKTFPASKYWYLFSIIYKFSVTHKITIYPFLSHAALRFSNTERVSELLKSNDMKIAGKKVYIFPACMEFFHDDPKLGEVVPEVKEVKVKKEVQYFASVFFRGVG